MNVLVAGDSIGAVVVALYAARKAGKDADARTVQDRAEFAARQREEREHDRRGAATRWQLDLLLQITETFERWQSVQRAHMPEQETMGTLLGLIRAYPGRLDVLWNWLVCEDASLRDLHAVAQQYGPVPDSLMPVDLARIELDHRLDGLRRELLPDN